MLYPMVWQLAFIHSKKNIGIITYIFFYFDINHKFWYNLIDNWGI